MFRREQTVDDEPDEVDPPEGVTLAEWKSVPEHLRPYYRPRPDVEAQLRHEVYAGAKRRPLVMQDLRGVEPRDGPQSRATHERLRDERYMARVGGTYDVAELPALIVETRMNEAADAYRAAQITAAGDELVRGLDVCRACGARGPTASLAIAGVSARLCDRCALAAPVVLGELYAADVVDDDGTTRAQRLRDLALADARA